ncbi:VOC family protein [Kangiella sp. TOML190]|uniref:VOC family protein n=1 Tax=Kangiella sp. TOML190 TaxID=2931351 RepID=UPI00203FDBBE|nr:VOC family protein [Kangiella sp. TOML190]
MITGIQQIHVQVENIERAIDFYQNTLGLTLVMSFPDQSMAFFDCGGTRLYLGKNPEYDSKAFIYYRSDNLEADVQNLKAKQVFIVKEPIMIHKTDQSESWLCAFKDSEGNILHLMQDKSI